MATRPNDFDTKSLPSRKFPTVFQILFFPKSDSFDGFTGIESVRYFSSRAR